MSKQNCNSVLMIRPTKFRRNEQTSVDNFFQKSLNLKSGQIIEKAQTEFDCFARELEVNGVNVLKFDDDLDSDTPDSVFPNNWISLDEYGRVVLYPMCAINRRKERRLDILDKLKSLNYFINEVKDYTSYENSGKYLEGTGSLILDRDNKKVYCSLSERSHKELVDFYCSDFGYTPITFHAFQTVDNQRKLVYHTNVMMCIGDQFALVCLASIDDLQERKFVHDNLTADNKEIIEITEAQVNHFAGNMLQLQGKGKNRIIALSQSAFDSLDERQKERLSKYGKLVYADLTTIETCGGGSARCMLAEIFLPSK